MWKMSRMVLLICGLCISPSLEQYTNFQTGILKVHNTYRAKHGCMPLQMNATLNAVAQDWAETLARRNKMEHRVRGKYGENIYSKWSSAVAKLNVTDVVTAWYKQIVYYNFSENKFNKRAGHFTQVVWNSSRQFGAGYAYNSTRKLFVVCNYNPPGNYAGLYKRNVPPPL